MSSPSPSFDLEGSGGPEKVSDPADESGGISDTRNNGKDQSATGSNGPPPVVQSTKGDSDSDSGGDLRRYSEEISPDSSPTQPAADKRAKANKELFSAIREGDLNAVRKAIESGADGKATDWIKETALHLACRFGHELIVEELLKDEAILQCLAERDDEGRTPLILACRKNYPGTGRIVGLLLSRSSGYEIEARSNKGRTALHWACSESSEDVVQLLLDSNADVNVYDHRNCTPLTIACESLSANIVQSLLNCGARCDVVDANGDTPLILASRYGEADMVRKILAWNPDSLYRKNKSGEDALRSAILNVGARDQTIPLLLDKGLRIDGDDAVRKVIEDLLASSDDRSAEAIQAAVKSILEHSSKADRVSVILKVDDRYFELLWELKKDLGVDRSICEVIRKWRKGLSVDDELQKLMQRLDPRKEMESATPQSALQLSAFCGEHILVWYLLKESQSKDEKDIKKALSLVEARKQESHTKVTSENDKKGKKPDRTRDAEKHKVDVDSKRFDYTIDILNNATKLAISKKQIIRPSRHYMDEKKDLLGNYRATIVSFYDRDGQIDLLRSSSSILDLVYGNQGDRVNDVMEKARSIFDEMTSTKPDKEVSKNDLLLRWIHLPVNNMDWMEHLTLRIYDAKNRDDRMLGDDKPEDGPQSEDVEDLLSFMDLAQRSRNELPTEKSDAKFMNPICLSEEPKYRFRYEPRLALYTPFVTFGYCYPPDEKSSMQWHAALLQEYRGRILHKTRSLDRFYYNTLNSSEMNDRDMSQVVTRRLLGLKPGDSLLKENQQWPYLTVDQLWLWVIDDKTIITSSTHREDGFDNLLAEKVWHQLLQMGFNKHPPSTVTEMSQFLVSTCVGFINNLTWHDACQGREGQFHQDGGHTPILLLFTDSINKVASQEKMLYKTYKDRIAEEHKKAMAEAAMKSAAKAASTEKKKSRYQTQQQPAGISNYSEDIERNKKDWQEINRAAELLDEVKDIRDELVMLRSLVAQQERVWSGLTGKDQGSSDVRNPSFIAHELDNMVKTTESIQKSINYFINVKQSMMSRDMVEKSANQSALLVNLRKRADEGSAENARQGKILYAFGFVTVVFTPLSFLTSFLALNTNTSRHNDEGELEYEASWMNRIVFGISAAIVGPFLIYAFFGDVMKKLIPVRDMNPGNATTERETTKSKTRRMWHIEEGQSSGNSTLNPLNPQPESLLPR